MDKTRYSFDALMKKTESVTNSLRLYFEAEEERDRLIEIKFIALKADIKESLEEVINYNDSFYMDCFKILSGSLCTQEKIMLLVNISEEDMKSDINKNESSSDLEKAMDKVKEFGEIEDDVKKMLNHVKMAINIVKSELSIRNKFHDVLISELEDDTKIFELGKLLICRQFLRGVDGKLVVGYENLDETSLND